MAHFRNPFQGLRWKLTLSYTLVTLATLLVIEIIVVAGLGFLFIYSGIFPNAMVSWVDGFIAPQVAPYLENPEPDVEGLSNWLQAAASEGFTFRSPENPNVTFRLGDLDQNAILMVLDPDLQLLASVPEPDADSLTALYEGSNEVLAAAYSGDKDPYKISRISNGKMTTAIPMMDDAGQVIGVVVLMITYPPQGSIFQVIILVGFSLIHFTIAAGLVGTVFGYLTARGLTKRLQTLSHAADSWSKGRFSIFVQDRSEDELGQLAQHLNQMAEQLQNLLQTQQELAALEERNRLARDLHDSVKQQVFATSMQVGAARASLEQNPQAAQAYLVEAEQLSRQAQKELTTLIHELRPASLQDQGLAQALKAYTADWSRQNSIDINLSLMDERILSSTIEQALFRVAQEALANVARHSDGAAVNIHLVYDSQTASLSISDDGRGFDIATSSGKGVGLKSMEERMTAIGGELKVKSAPGQGTQIVARCPINGEYV